MPHSAFHQLKIYLLVAASVVALGAGCARRASNDTADTAYQPPPDVTITTTSTPLATTTGTSAKLFPPTTTATKPPSTREESLTELNRLFTSLNSVVDGFGVRIESNPTMLTETQRATWTKGKKLIATARQKTEAAIKVLSATNPTNWQTAAEHAKAELQEYAKQYLTTKLDVLGITVEDLEKQP